MSYYLSRAAWLLLAAGVWHCTAATAGVAEGIAAIDKGRYRAALQELRPLAERGDAVAQYRLGWMYELGKGVAPDKVRAISWYRKAADQGNASAQVALGVIYGTGDGVSQDDAQAASWLRKAAMQGDPTAQYNLGVMYFRGRGVPKDETQGLAWFLRAAEQGDDSAQANIGSAYEYGGGVAKNYVLAYANYAIAARGGNEKYASLRDAVAKQLTPQQVREARAMAAAWTMGKPMPGEPGALKEPAIAVASVPANPPMAEGIDAKGTLIYKSRAGAFTANLKYAWFVKGPDAVDTSKTVRHVILSATDIGPALQSCKTMMCADGHLTEGMTVDFDAGPRLNYWISLNGQKVQYSGTVTPDAFAARVNDARHLAGWLAIDDAAAGGAKVDVEFNGKLFKEFKPER